ncbi:MAG: mannonate dehydratase [Anaerolineae bacterium]|nr:mannonate dehydratase [Anaerolineae bacterium]
MRVALGQFQELTHERLTFAKQIGVAGVQMNTPLFPAERGYWEYDDLRRARERCEDYGLRLEALENVPRLWYLKAMLGLPGRDEEIENYRTTIRNMGKAGIPLLGYNWMPNGVWRTPNARGRGGVIVTAFDMDKIEASPLVAGVHAVDQMEGRTLSREQMWDNYTYFIKAVLPVAEESGVKLALHPDDPPVEELGGIPRLFYNAEGFQRAMEEIAPSPNHGLDFCMGCFSEMGPGAIDAIRYFGTRKLIFYVHFRDVQGCSPVFQECFLGEGNVNVVEAMRTLKEIGFDGFIIDDHVPKMIDDSDWNHRGHAHATGYILGLVEAVNQLA